ncbi:hypothetical protein [Myxacorys almedinensis]|uniref:Uncharacterized protein n=1 Tax=Myxacorys almedinensis A TaxID=2690445 RepID=A0A8J7YYS9_9CYAN|nr:hypothetical protein [Myxacorys almedinensis]NDJ15865.1 hypothetical protein [Myxacorys almedinensis A]
MKQTLKRALMPGLMATGLISATFLPAKPASADQNVWRDIGIGAATGAVSSIVTKHKVVPNIINGAAAGAAVNQSRDLSTRKGQRPDVLRDAGFGAAAGAAAGGVTNRRHTIRNAANGAAVGAVINILTPQPRR